MFWTYRLVNVSYDARHYVQEMLPIGSTYDHGGYMAPDGKRFSKMMRDRVQLIALQYKEIADIQERFQEDQLSY